MQLKYHMVTIEDQVPENHFLRKLEDALDLGVYEETTHLYSRKYGRPPIGPVVMVKYLLVGFLYGIPSARQIEERCADSNALCGYLGIDLDEQAPDHSAISAICGGESRRFGRCSAVCLKRKADKTGKKGQPTQP